MLCRSSYARAERIRGKEGRGRGKRTKDLEDWRVLTSGFLDPFSAFGSEGDCGGVV